MLTGKIPNNIVREAIPRAEADPALEVAYAFEQLTKVRNKLHPYKVPMAELTTYFFGDESREIEF